jgi:CheY-like chemotaxis protein
MNSDTGPLVMVIDDDADIREMIKVLLEIDGYRVVTAIDGVDGMEKLSAEEEPALILLDLMMPKMDGEQFIVALRRSGRTKIPVIVMSGHSVSGKRADKFRGHPCLTKPVELDELIAVVRRFAGHGISRTIPRRRQA